MSVNCLARENVLFVACKLQDGSYKFIELPFGCCVVGVYTESHLLRCYRALVDNGLASDFSKDS